MQYAIDNQKAVLLLRSIQMQVRLIGGHHHGEKISLEDDELTFPLRMAYPDGPVNYRLEFDVIIASAKVFLNYIFQQSLFLFR